MTSATGPDLRAAAEKFFDACRHLHEAMQGPDSPSHTTRVEVAQLAADSVAVARMIDELRPAIVDFWRQREQDSGKQLLVSAPFGGSIADEPIGPLILLVKVLFLFLRAYQDAIYTLVFEMRTKRRPSNARMQHAISHPESIVGKEIAERLTGYGDWFKEFRELRNAIKTGASFSLLAPPEDVGVMFTSTTDAGEYVMFDVEAPIIRLSHLAGSFAVSEALTRMALDLWTDLRSAQS